MYTFSIPSHEFDGRLYPKSLCINDSDFQPGTGILDLHWTPNIKEAMVWNDETLVDIIASEFIDAKIEKIVDKGLVKVTEVSNRHKFLSFRIAGLDDGILVGVTYPNLPLDDPRQGFSIAYKGDVIVTPFSMVEDPVEEINASVERILGSKLPDEELIKAAKGIFDGIQDVRVVTEGD